MNFFVLLLISELITDFVVSTNDDIFLLDFFASTSADKIENDQDTFATNSSLSEQLEVNISNSNLTQTANAHSKHHHVYDMSSYSSSDNGQNSTLSNNLSGSQNLIDPASIKTNFKLKKQKLFFGKKLLLWKRNSQRGYGAFLMLCEPDITCVTPQTKLAIANCMNSGGSALANQLYNSCSNQNRIQCTDQDVARRLLGCLRLQSANNILITPQSRACVRQVVTLGTLDCFVKILRQKPKYRLGTRYSTISTDAGAVTAAGIGEGNVDGVEDPDSEPNGRRMSKREIDENVNLADENKTNELIVEMANDAIQLVTASYDDEKFGDLSRAYLNDSNGDQYFSETNENYDPFNEIMLDLKGNLTSNETSSDDDDEFEEAMDGEDDDSVPISSMETDTNAPMFDPQINQTNVRTNETIYRSKRQCRHNRRYHNRRYRPRDRSGRAHRRTHFNNFKEESQDLKENDDEEQEEKKWELLSKRRG